jgi:hypothetical protein
MHNIENEKGTLTQLLQTVQERHNRSADFLTSTNNLAKVTDVDGNPQLVIEQNGGEPTRILKINEFTQGQIAAAAEIDTRTARRLQSNYPAWQKEPVNRMVRTYLDADEHGGTARAFVSDKFKTFDNVNLLQASLPQLMESDAQWKVVNADVSDKRLYLRLKSENQTGTGAAVGDVMANGIGFQNSEVGAGSVSVYQISWTLACINGMQTQNKTRSSHITSARDQSDYGLLSNEAKDADNRALELKLRDLTAAYASRESFDAVLDQMRRAADDVIEGEYEVVDIVESVGTVLKLSKKENNDVLNGLMQTIGQSGYEQGRPLSRATLVNAVTACAHKADVDDVDMWQERGGQLLNISNRDWARIAA